MTTTKRPKTTALCLILLLTAFTITLTNATTENNYKNDTNPLSGISESTHKENDYKTYIIINPHTTGIYTKENGFNLDLTINPQGIGSALTENNYRLDLIPEKTFPDMVDILDIALISVVLSKIVLFIDSFVMPIYVTVENQGGHAETFTVTLYADKDTTIIGDEVVIETQKISNLVGGAKSTTTFWLWGNTLVKGIYTISAHAWPILGEVDTADNTYQDGVVIATYVGDFDGDDDVDYDDIVYFVTAYIRYWSGMGKDPACDFDSDCDVDYDDILIFVSAYIDYWTP